MNEPNLVTASLIELPPEIPEFDRERWEQAWQAREKYGQLLKQTAKALPPSERKQMLKLGDWFAANDSLDSLFQRPDALQAYLPLYESHNAAYDQDQLDSAVTCGLWGRQIGQVGQRHVLRQLYAPLMVAFCCLIVIVVGCYGLVPQFEKLFFGFGMDLPKTSIALFGFARFVVSIWWVLLSFPLIAILFIAIMDRKGGGGRPVNVSWLDVKLTSFRQTLADWAWHVSLLLDSGFDYQQAVDTASNAVINRRKRQNIKDQIDFRDFAKETDSVTTFADAGFPLVDFALKQEKSNCQSALLKEVARYYWDQNQNVGSWWVSWLATGIIWLFWAMVALAFSALFFPLYAIIRGLMW